MKLNDYLLSVLCLNFSILVCSEVAYAVDAKAVTSVTVISPSKVAADAAAELLFSASVGVLTLTIPGSAGLLSDANAGGELTLTSSGVSGNSIVFSVSDAAAISALIEALSASGGSFGVAGLLSTGQGVHLVVTGATQAEGGKVYAIVAYN